MTRDLIWSVLVILVAALAGCRSEEPTSLGDGGGSTSGDERRDHWQERQQAETPEAPAVPMPSASMRDEVPVVSEDVMAEGNDVERGETKMESEADRFLREEEAQIEKDMPGKRSKYGPGGREDVEE
jgi:hypothetical protein